MNTLRSTALLSLLPGLILASTALADDGPPLARIGFGSCIKQEKPQPIWEAVVAAQPELFLLLGDNIYADTENMEAMAAMYESLAQNGGFQKLRATCPLLATWDDHDYGANDAGAEYPKRREAQQVFLDFLKVPKDSPRRAQAGVYSASVFGPPGKRVQIILLDQRYFRGPLVTGFVPGEVGEGVRGKYAPNTDRAATVLGETQWAWLAEQLRVPAELRLLGASFQFVSHEHGSECWGNFPHERERMLKLLRETGAEGVVILSGDRHTAEISRLSAAESGLGYPLWDVTSSSLNQPSGNLTKTGLRFVNEVNSHRVGLVYPETNFGLVEIDWKSADPVVRLQVRDEQGGVVLQQRFPLSLLKHPAAR